jgi:hypothetical protein
VQSDEVGRSNAQAADQIPNIKAEVRTYIYINTWHLVIYLHAYLYYELVADAMSNVNGGDQ